MRLGAQADVVKVILYVIASFALAAIISPYLFEVGKGFAHVVEGRNTAEGVVWLGEKAERADFETYFKRALLISALVCLIPFFLSLGLRQTPRDRASDPWSMKLPSSNFAQEVGQPLRKSRRGFRHAMVGFLLATGFFFLMAIILFKMHWLQWDREASRIQLWESFGKAIKTALAVSVLEEVFFRGALMGIFLRAFRPSVAIVGISLIFAAVHFLTPPADAVITNPRAAGAGFELLALTVKKFLQPEALIVSFIPLFLVGVILGIARYRTASLWLPLGLHAGWIFSAKMAGRLVEQRNDFPDHLNLFMGKKITEGLIPIATLIMTGIMVLLYLRLTHPPQPEEELE